MTGVNSPSLWGTIGGIIKYFRFDYDYVLWGISWANLSLLLASIPSLDDDEEDEEGQEEEVKHVGFDELAAFLNMRG